MQLVVDGAKIFAATGGRGFDPALPLVVFLHGAGLDHTVWALLARWFAHRGRAVLAPDLPGHGRSGGAPLDSIAAMADWTAALIEAAGAGEAASSATRWGRWSRSRPPPAIPERVSALGLIATAAAMPVSRDLLDAAAADDHAAIDMLRIWGYGFRAGIGGSLAPGPVDARRRRAPARTGAPGRPVQGPLGLQRLSRRARLRGARDGAGDARPGRARHDDSRARPAGSWLPPCPTPAWSCSRAPATC